MSMKSRLATQAVVTAARSQIIRILNVLDFNCVRVGSVAISRESVVAAVYLPAVRTDPIAVAPS
jgi:hypothetical protein